MWKTQITVGELVEHFQLFAKTYQGGAESYKVGTPFISNFVTTLQQILPRMTIYENDSTVSGGLLITLLPLDQCRADMEKHFPGFQDIVDPMSDTMGGPVNRHRRMRNLTKKEWHDRFFPMQIGSYPLGTRYLALGKHAIPIRDEQSTAWGHTSSRTNHNSNQLVQSSESSNNNNNTSSTTTTTSTPSHQQDFL